MGRALKLLSILKSIGTELVITVDCGAAAKAALASVQLRSTLPVIVLDHHLMQGALASRVQHL